MRLLLSFLLSAILFTLTVHSSCKVSLTTTARNGGFFPSGTAGISQIYDITVTNTGSCDVYSVSLNISTPGASSITSNWNLVNETLYYSVSTFGQNLTSGDSINAGFIVFFPNTRSIPRGVSVSLYSTDCSQCNAPDTITTSSTSSTSSSTSSTTTTGNQICQVSAIASHDQAPFSSGNGISQIYDIVVTNIGSCVVNNVVFNISLPSGSSISSWWNLQIKNAQQYTLTHYGGIMLPGSHVSAGFIVYFNTQTISQDSVNVLTTTTSCIQCPTNPSSSSSSTTSSPLTTTTTTTTGNQNTCSALYTTSSITNEFFAPPYTSSSSLIYQYTASIENRGIVDITQVTINITGDVISISPLVQNTDGTYSLPISQILTPIGSPNSHLQFQFFTHGSENSTIAILTCSSSGNPNTGSPTTSTSGSTTTSTTTTNGSLKCTGLSLSIAPRFQSSYPFGNGTSQIYDVTVTNRGPCSSSYVEIGVFSPTNSNGVITSSWNLLYTQGNSYVFTNFGQRILNNQSVTAGFVMNFPDTQSIPSGVHVTLIDSLCSC